jgi:hypothetical protein
MSCRPSLFPVTTQGILSDKRLLITCQKKVKNKFIVFIKKEAGDSKQITTKREAGTILLTLI